MKMVSWPYRLIVITGITLLAVFLASTNSYATQEESLVITPNPETAQMNVVVVVNLDDELRIIRISEFDDFKSLVLRKFHRNAGSTLEILSFTHDNMTTTQPTWNKFRELVKAIPIDSPSKPEVRVKENKIATKNIRIPSLWIGSDDLLVPSLRQHLAWDLETIEDELRVVLRKLSILVMTHSSTENIHPIFFSNLERFVRQSYFEAMGLDLEVYVCINVRLPSIPDWASTILYADEKVFSERLRHCSKHVSGDLVIVLQEDWIPVARSDWARIGMAGGLILSPHSHVDHVQLIRYGWRRRFSNREPAYVVPELCKQTMYVHAPLVFSQTFLEHLASHKLEDCHDKTENPVGFEADLLYGGKCLTMLNASGFLPQGLVGFQNYSRKIDTGSPPLERTPKRQTAFPSINLVTLGNIWEGHTKCCMVQAYEEELQDFITANKTNRACGDGLEGRWLHEDTARTFFNWKRGRCERPKEQEASLSH